LLQLVGVTAVFLLLSALFTGFETATSLTGWARIPSSLEHCQLCKADAHAVAGVSFWGHYQL